MRTKSLLIEVIASLYLCLYLYTAISKLANFDLSVAQLNKQPFPDAYTPILVWLIPGFELLGGGLLLFSRTKLSGLYLCVGLMSIFTIYVSLVMLNYYGHIPCSCGGLISSLSWKQHLYFNITYMVSGIVAIILYREQDEK